MKFLYSLLLTGLIIAVIPSQLKITNNQNPVIDSSLILEVDNSSNKGVLIPEINITTSIYDDTNPVMNPAEGLLIYNKGDNPRFFPGFYIWHNGHWNLLADNKNMVNDLVIKSNTLNASVLSSSPTASQILDFLDVPLFSNNIGTATYTNSGNHSVHLPKGYFNVKVELDFTVNSLATEDIQGGVNVLIFKGELIDANTGQALSTIVANSIIRNISKTGLMAFDLDLRIDNPKDIQFKLSNFSGSSYYGPITIDQFKMHVQTIK